MEGSATTTNRRRRRLLYIASLCLLLATPAAPSPPLLPRSSPFLGISPQDEWYYESALIACRDGSKSFSRDRLNDDFCDCVDGTDEPGQFSCCHYCSCATTICSGTSACPESRFYCRNVGNTPQLLFSSRVNDHICDCCDGSDEYDGIVNCPNTCFTARITHQMNESSGTLTYGHNINTREGKNRSHLEELVQKLKELKMIVIMEVILLGCVIVFGFSRKRITSRRRQHI